MSDRKLLTWYSTMVRIRLFEEKAHELYTRGLIRGLSIFVTGKRPCPSGPWRRFGRRIARGVSLEAAFGELMGREPWIAVTFFGDGASNIGTFHEALNMAAVWKAPIVFICENNLYGEFSPLRTTTSVDSIAKRACAYCIPGTVVDGMDVVAVHSAVSKAARDCRRGRLPVALAGRRGLHLPRRRIRGGVGSDKFDDAWATFTERRDGAIPVMLTP